MQTQILYSIVGCVDALYFDSSKQIDGYLNYESIAITNYIERGRNLRYS